ncbi:MAG: sigma-54-dependent Fis family transcriptional regulator [Myxococcales bacterium]|nr:sigma-54-dependent Fis family transcriptional regulator [Myxococcales bacterium]
MLIVDDELSIRDSLRHWFRKDGYDVAAAESGPDALRQMEGEPFDVVLLDIKMPGMDGMEVLRRLHELSPDSVVIMLTAHGTIETAVEALKIGACDYRTKPIDPDELGRLITRALEERASQRQRGKAPGPVSGGKPPAEEIVAASPQMQEVARMIDSLAESDVTVLIRGDSGTGKELVARAIHERSARHVFPLVAFNCGAIPESLLESELFGHERGAFTGAQSRRRGKLEQADHGTLFLDEIGTIGLRTQVELLRVLETKEFTRIGGQTSVHSDFRVICATNQDLEELVAKKEMREDLYFRINVFRIDVPPLRERAGDVTLLARHFLKVFAEKTERALTDLTPDALAALNRYAWPGNVRELRNMMERAVLLATPPLVQVKDLVGLGATLPTSARAEAPLAGSLAESERAHILTVLCQCEWNISQAARVLEIDRVTLYNKIKKYGLRSE